MSNVDFFNPREVPQPRDRVKVEKLEAKPYPDGWRVRVVLDVTPFQERPSLEIRVRSADGRVVSELSVIETMIWHLEFTIHIRGITWLRLRCITAMIPPRFNTRSKRRSR